MGYHIINENNGNVDPYEELAIAIIIRAKEDWDRGLRQVKKQLKGYTYKKLIEDLEYVEYNRSMKSKNELLKDKKYQKLLCDLQPYFTNTYIDQVQNFLNSNWFEMLCLKLDPMVIREEFENSKKRVMG